MDHRLRGPPGKRKKKKKKQTPCRICSPSTLPRAPPHVYQLQPTAEIKIWSVHPRLQESIIKHSHWGGLCPIDRRVQPQRHVGTYLLPTASIGTPAYLSHIISSIPVSRRFYSPWTLGDAPQKKTASVPGTHAHKPSLDHCS